ncbi:hypothetical protein Tco_1434292 [Tanacetum coccineum]
MMSMSVLWQEDVRIVTVGEAKTKRSPVFDDDYEEASVFNDDQFEKNRCRFMIPILKMSLWRKNDLLGKEDLVRKKKTWKTL